MIKTLFGTCLSGVTAVGLLLITGCVTPDTSRNNQIALDDEPLQGGISSQDVRTVAIKMAPGILAVPEIAQSSTPVRIKIADFKNTSRFFIDSSLFTKRLRLELNRYGAGRVRFLNNNGNVQQSRTAILKDRESDMIQQSLKQLAAEIAASPLFKQPKPVKIAVIPVLNTNLVNMNADSFAAMLRAEIANASAGRIQFLMPGAVAGADYYLTGQFIPETMKKEGIVNMQNYIEIMDDRIRTGKSIYVSDVKAAAMSWRGAAAIGTDTRVDILIRELSNPAYRVKPDINKRLNIMIIKPDTKIAVYEKMFLLDRKITDNSKIANLILSGEISGMHQRKNGVSSDYLLISVQLTNPESNEMIWEDAYEVKKLSKEGIVYR